LNKWGGWFAFLSSVRAGFLEQITLVMGQGLIWVTSLRFSKINAAIYESPNKGALVRGRTEILSLKTKQPTVFQTSLGEQ